jgi:SNF2 family DNA or RNA helicase
VSRCQAKCVLSSTKSRKLCQKRNTADDPFVIQRGLDCAQIRYVRVDGTLSPARRQTALQQLQSTDEIKVILLAISCGVVGLDLTAASRVHLLEPQWNPAVEEQVLARVHRTGQKKPVITMRYIMRDSIEEVRCSPF